MLDSHPSQKTSIEQIGSVSLAQQIQNSFPVQNKSTLVAQGDDASILDYKTKKTVTSGLLWVEGVHFDLSYAPLKHLGYKTVVASISNISAMHAVPAQISIQLALSNRFSLEAIEEFYEGVRLASSFYKIDLIYNQLTSSQKGLIISSSVFGEVKKDAFVGRNTAKENQLLVLSGDIGAAYMGLQVLEREKQVYLVNPNNQPDLDNYNYIIERQLKPEARTDIKDILDKLEVKPTAMTLVNDGLAAAIMHLSMRSSVGCTLYEEKLPIDPQVYNVCEEFNLNTTTIAINGGEDYELLFTIAMEDYDKIKGNPNLSVIGHTVAVSEGNHLITRDATKIPLKARGF
ncbi:thiamine-phosphate kinase [Capnocytophaga sp. ARDL2]|uniref:thiamine-phosphate kinase n=1 Tax=Capnocytophaga sp. ARDL2 TaxID=3238809 RepID=UPI003558434D